MAEQSTVRQVRCRGTNARKQFATTKLFAPDFDFLTFALFAIQQIAIFRFELFALYNADRATCPWPGMTPVSGRWPQAGAASVVLPHEAVKLEGTLEG